MIAWIPSKKRIPKVYKRIDEDGKPYESSNQILIWTTDVDEPIGVGCYEDGMFYINGIGVHDVEYWAYITTPDGHILQQEYMG